MQNLFRYAKAKHIRRHRPTRMYKDCRTYKKYLRKEFSGQCVYCLLPDAPKGQESFGVDHYRPVSLFRHLETRYDNLFYACNTCNSRKREFWPSKEQLSQGVFVPNPCDYEMFSHMRYSGASVEARTEAGKWAVDLLDLNDDVSVAYRSKLISVFLRLTRELSAWEAMHSAIRIKMELVESQDQKELYASALLAAESEIASLLDDLKLIIPDVDDT